MDHAHEAAPRRHAALPSPARSHSMVGEPHIQETTMIHGLKLLACAGALALLSSTAGAADPIKIGVDGPFTGGSSSMGVSMRDGVRLAIEEINKSGGVLGRPLQAVERDDEAKNERGVQIAEELINKEKVVATVGIHQHRRRARVAALLPGSQDPGHQQRRDRIGHHEAVHRPARQLRVPQRGQRLDPGADDRRRGGQARLQEGRDPGRLDQLRAARQGRPREGARREGHEGRRRREVQHQGRRHDARSC